MGTPANPYAPPTADEALQVESEGFVYRPANTLAFALMTLLGLSVVALLISTYSMQLQVDLLQRAARGGVITIEQANANDQRVQLLAGVWLVMLLSTGVVWCVWQVRTSKNVRALGAVYLEHGPHAWGWFFCPIANLWKPLSVLNELWAASPPTDNATSRELWRRTEPPTLIAGGWWLCFIGGGLLNRVSDQMLKDTDDIDALISGSQYLSVGWLVWAVSGVFAVLYVYLLSQRVQRRAAALQS